jgi:quercetin dioxygenase-like cupin family protein
VASTFRRKDKRTDIDATSMTLITLLTPLVVAVTWALLAQGAPNPTYMVPAAREPHHDVKLDNQYVRLLDVTVPAWDSTLFHIHENPYVYVSIGAATLKAQVAGSNDFTDLNLVDGEVRYSAAVTHRVGNVVGTPFRNITIQIQGRDGTAATSPAAAAPVNGSSQVVDNEIIHVDRLVLAPGQSTGRHVHSRYSILVAVHEGVVRTEVDAQAATQATMRPGDFQPHGGPFAHAITNVGTSRFEAIEVLWK